MLNFNLKFIPNRAHRNTYDRERKNKLNTYSGYKFLIIKNRNTHSNKQKVAFAGNKKRSRRARGTEFIWTY